METHKKTLYHETSDTIPANYKKYNYSANLPYGEEVNNSIWNYCRF